MTGSRLIAPLFALTSGLLAQETGTREAEIGAEREKKAASLQPDNVDQVERVMTDFKDKKYLERFTAGIGGVRLKFGGGVTGGGFALGPEYFRNDLADGRILARGAYLVSFGGYQKTDLQFNFMPEKRSRFSAQFYAVRHNYPGLQYYGPGPDSAKTGRSNYRYEDVAVDGTLGVRLAKGKLLIAGSGGKLWVNTGPGNRDGIASSEQLYGLPRTAGMNVQPSFARGGGYMEFDTTDVRTGPRSGTYIGANYSRYFDLETSRFNFQRADIDFQQFVPVFNKRRVFAFRNRTSTAWAAAGSRVPFYLQPVIGGSDDLRGFRPFRFYDDHAVLWNAEYRWEIFAGLDGALFFDAGQVAPRFKDIKFKDHETSWGFGFRANARNSVFLRLDIGFSHEGFQIWFKFSDAFIPRRIISSSAQIVQ